MFKSEAISSVNDISNSIRNFHVKFSDTDRKFWQFSMHEVGIYDYKAVIDFILPKTGVKQLSVVAHSEGTSAFFIFASQRPKYNKKVKVFIALAPVTYIQYSGPGVKVILESSPITLTFLSKINHEEILGYHSFGKKLLNKICTQGKAGYEFCFNLFGIIAGFNPENIEQDFASTIIGHFPAGTSRKTLSHYGSNFYQHRFQQYDYGPENLAVYGTSRPPAYDLKKITTKVALFAAKGDLITGIKDILRIKKNLPNVVNYQVVDDNHFNHMDYIWGRNAHMVLYKFVIELLLRYN